MTIKSKNLFKDKSFENKNKIMITRSKFKVKFLKVSYKKIITIYTAIIKL